MSEAKRMTKARKDDKAMEFIGRCNKVVVMERRVQMLLRNALVSKSECTLASKEVLIEMGLRLGYDLEMLSKLDIADPSVNPFAKR